MQRMQAQNVLSYVLTEDEWYAGTEQQREAWQVECQREAATLECRYASLMVEPDPIMSMSPIARRHTVWRYAAPTSAEEDFVSSLVAVQEMHRAHLTAQRMAYLSSTVFPK